jgi:hypothetical protein
MTESVLPCNGTIQLSNPDEAALARLLQGRLLCCCVRKGMTREQVVRLFGRADSGFMFGFGAVYWSYRSLGVNVWFQGDVDGCTVPRLMIVNASSGKNEGTAQQAQPCPPLKIMLREPAHNDRKQKSSFFTALASLSRKHGTKLDNYIPHDVDEGFAVEVGGGRVAAVLRGDNGVIPGSDTQYLLLLDQEGKLLDRLSCAISNRHCMVVGTQDRFRTDVLAVPEADGARLVIRYNPPSGQRISGNWGHEITQRGNTHTFLWDQSRPSAIRSSEWKSKGLCRMAVRGDKFTLVFPPLGEPNSH